MFEGIQENENWRNRFNKELMRKFEDLDKLSFVRISRLNWICNINPLNTELNPICHLLALLGVHLIFHVSKIRVKRTVSNRKVSQLFNNNPH
jgi:hypothetical protein